MAIFNSYVKLPDGTSYPTIPNFTRKFLRIHVDHMSGFNQSPQFGECLAWFNEAPIGPIFRLWISIVKMAEIGEIPMILTVFSDLLWIWQNLWVIFQPSTCLSHFLFFAKKNPRNAGSSRGLLRSSSSLVSEPGQRIRHLAWGNHPLLNGRTFQRWVKLKIPWLIDCYRGLCYLVYWGLW